MRDGRVLCCEDGFGGPARSYPNDGLYVYQPNVVVSANSAAVGSGSTGTVSLTASSLPAGFSGARLTVSVSNPEVASITGISFPDALGLTESSISDDGSSATIRVADVDTNVQSGAMDISLATLDVRANGGGTTDLTVSIEQMDDEAGNAIEAETRNGIVVGGPQTVVGDAAPTDPDGDGHFEDLNGNGRLDYEDVQVLFSNMDSDSVRLNTGAYDFNENGQIDFADVAALYEEVN
jgi:PKD repeat protein